VIIFYLTTRLRLSPKKIFVEKKEIQFANHVAKIVQKVAKKSSFCFFGFRGSILWKGRFGAPANTSTLSAAPAQKPKLFCFKKATKNKIN